MRDDKTIDFDRLVNVHVGVDLGRWKMGLAATWKEAAWRTKARPVLIERTACWSKEKAANVLLDAFFGLEILRRAESVKVHIEQPQHYGGGRAALQKHAEELHDLAEFVRDEIRAASGGPASLSVKLYPPFRWKANTPKTVHHRRLAARILTPEELHGLVESDWKKAHQDVWDAIGLALFGAGRCGRGGTRT